MGSGGGNHDEVGEATFWLGGLSLWTNLGHDLSIVYQVGRSVGRLASRAGARTIGGLR